MTDDDWRLQGQGRYLTGAHFRRKPYTTRSQRREHDHCEFCWDKFAEENLIPGALQEGWPLVGSTDFPDDNRWICPPCFEDFRDRLELVGEESSPERSSS